MSAVIVLRKLETDHGRVEIGQRPGDGFIHLTALADAGGKRIHDWFATKRAQEFLEVFRNENPGCMPYELIKGRGKDQGYWGDVRVALSVAQWISARFEYQVTEWLKWWFTEGYKYQTRVREMLDMYIAPDPKHWEKRYTDEYYFHVYRLWGKADDWYPGKTDHAPWVGGVTGDIIYDRQFPAEVVAEMRRLNPRRAGRGSGRRRKHMQHLTNMADQAHLKPAVYLAVSILQRAGSKEHFKRMFDFVAPKDKRQLIMPFEDFVA